MCLLVVFLSMLNLFSSTTVHVHFCLSSLAAVSAEWIYFAFFLFFCFFLVVFVFYFGIRWFFCVWCVVFSFVIPFVCVQFSFDFLLFLFGYLLVFSII